MDHHTLAAELLRAVRGKRSQKAFARRLGYRSNVLSRWESGLSFPTAAQSFQAMRAAGIDVKQGLVRFFSAERPFLAQNHPERPAGVVALLADLRGATPIHHLARQTGYSRFQLSRWLSGQSELRLPEFLHLVDVLSLRLPDFIGAFIDAASLPSLRALWDQLSAAREAAFARPWSHAVLRALELTQVRALKRHAPGFLAGLLGISVAEEQECLALLARAGQVERRAGRWRLRASLAVDLRAQPERLRELKSFWLTLADARQRKGADGVFSFNVFAVAERDLAALRELHLAFYQQLSRRIAASEPSECVALYSAQLFRIDAPVHARPG
jgi:transcriptional regulator with XRE-family HTH domain